MGFMLLAGLFFFSKIGKTKKYATLQPSFHPLTQSLFPIERAGRYVNVDA